ncbi:hypothetical protein Rhe02_67330 [Rhizocola hellebori]|uniref:Uncharacterized protein n=1 Tax=Rhizocola hellebori TaxID=1392758 RepID=A0A8J3VK26_9ACTN|nr:hypothetical protein [Rhizocola hellebori]GIH08666.1 hypothetical protein Rhe02_67330 [Rhizocola hellebori]
MTEAGVWQQLDYTAGLPLRRTRKRLAITLIAITVAAMGLVVVFRSGVITPRVGWPRRSAGWGAEHGPGHLAIGLPVENQGLIPVTIVGIGQNLPGFELEPPQAGLFPVTLQPGQQIELRVAYRVTDCAAFPRLSVIPVQIQRSWGTQTGRVEFDGLQHLSCQTPLDQG